jgi:hypothetical protein
LVDLPLIAFVAPDHPRMSDTPTFANLLTQWTGGDLAARVGVYAHLRNDPLAASALEASMRGELTSELPTNQVRAAEAMVEVYGDEPAAADALGWALRRGDPAVAIDTLPVLQKLAVERAGPLLADFALYSPAAFRALPPDTLRWAGSTAARAGDSAWWAAVFNRAGQEAECALLMGLADAAPSVPYDLSDLEPVVRQRLFHAGPGYAAGAALWRLTWRIHRDWLASVNPYSPRLRETPLLVFLIEVLTEHLGRRPDLAGLVRDLVVRLADDDPTEFRESARRLAGRGHGWAVLLPILGSSANAETRAHLFREAADRSDARALAHHHAVAVVLARDLDRSAVSADLLEAACAVLRGLGPAAGFAVPDLLNLIAKQPDLALIVTPILPALAPGFPMSVAAVARTLDRLRRATGFDPVAFAYLAEVYAALNRDGWTAVLDDTSFDPRTLDTLLQRPQWRDAPPSARQKDATALADRFAAPRAEVRARAAELLRHYPDQIPALWPALVAVLAGGDERLGLLVVPYFRHLGPVADAVTPELTALFREPNPVYAARAVLALWRLGRMPLVAADLRASVTTESESAWGWAVLHGVVDRVFQAHGLLSDLTSVFAAAPQEIAAKVHALLNPPESLEERALSAHVREEPDPAGGPRVNWDGVYQCVGSDAEGGLLFLALMCAFGSAGFASQKVWMIKHQRTLANNGLGEAKAIVERALERLTVNATATDRTTCVRDYFGSGDIAPPPALTKLLDHRLSWYRWAGLELLDAWGLSHLTVGLIEDRVADRSALVRARALRLYQG